MKAMTKHIQRVAGDERGAILVQVAIAILVLTALSTFVVDHGILWVSRGQAQNAADAGALSGAVARAFDEQTDPPASNGQPYESAPGAALEPALFERAHEVQEIRARRTKGMMIVVCPPHTEPVLAAFLDLPGAVAAFPISALVGKDDVAGHVASDHFNDAIEQAQRRAEIIRVARPRFPKLESLENRFQAVAIMRGKIKPAIAAPLDGRELW